MKRYYKGKQREKYNPIERFWQRVDKNKNGCWLWTGPLDTHGYANHYKGKPLPLVVKAHRFAMEQHTGKQYDPWVTIAHTCSNRNCVRAEHLKIGEPLDPKKFNNRKNGPRPHTWKYGPDPSRKRLHLAFMRGKAQANFRQEQWDFDFYDFEKRWGGRHHETGIGATDIVMVRIDPADSWNINNTKLMPRGANQGRMHGLKKKQGLKPSYRFGRGF